MSFIIANAANLVFLLFMAGLLLQTVIKSKAIQLILLFLLAQVLLFVDCYHGMTIIELTRGVIGDLSVSGLLFITSLIAINLLKIQINMFDRYFCLAIVIIGAVLYLSTIDLLRVDIYGLGYLPDGLLVIILLLSMFFLYANTVFSVIWLIALTLFLAKAQSSVNLWDYLIDPVLWLFCIYGLIFRKSSS